LLTKEGSCSRRMEINIKNGHYHILKYCLTTSGTIVFSYFIFQEYIQRNRIALICEAVYNIFLLVHFPKVVPVVPVTRERQ